MWRYSRVSPCSHLPSKDDSRLSLTLVSGQRIQHIVAVLFFLARNRFHKRARGWIVIRKKVNQFPVMW
jgi:hypothetical protein